MTFLDSKVTLMNSSYKDSSESKWTLKASLPTRSSLITPRGDKVKLFWEEVNDMQQIIRNKNNIVFNFIFSDDVKNNYKNK